MAKIVITIEDTGDGKASIKSEPLVALIAAKGKDHGWSPAELLAIEMFAGFVPENIKAKYRESKASSVESSTH